MKLNPNMIIRIVADYYGQSLERVMTTCRKMELVKVRQVSAYFIKAVYFQNRSLHFIGMLFPGKEKYKDHATILYAVRQVKNHIAFDSHYKKEIDEIAEIINISGRVKDLKPVIDQIENALITENRYLRLEILNLKRKVNELEGKNFALKTNKKKPVKREYLRAALKPIDKKIVELPLYKSPFSEVEAANGREYSGFREHSI